MSSRKQKQKQKQKATGELKLKHICMKTLSSYYRKTPLDATRLNELKMLVFSRFPVESPVEKEKCRKFVKGKINGKCRLNKHIHKQAAEIGER